MSMFTLAVPFDHFQFALIHGPNIPDSYATLLFTVSDLASITSHIHNWASFLLWLHLFILSGVIFLLFSSNILGTYWPGEFIFQCHIFLPFHTVHGVLKARMLKWFAIPFSSGPRFVRTSSPLWPIHLGWPCTAWLIASLSYTNPFTTVRLWTEGVCILNALRRVYNISITCSLFDYMLKWQYFGYTGLNQTYN